MELQGIHHCVRDWNPDHADPVKEQDGSSGKCQQPSDGKNNNVPQTLAQQTINSLHWKCSGWLCVTYKYCHWCMDVLYTWKPSMCIMCPHRCMQSKVHIQCKMQLSNNCGPISSLRYMLWLLGCFWRRWLHWISPSIPHGFESLRSSWHMMHEPCCTTSSGVSMSSSSSSLMSSKSMVNLACCAFICIIIASWCAFAAHFFNVSASMPKSMAKSTLQHACTSSGTTLAIFPRIQPTCTIYGLKCSACSIAQMISIKFLPSSNTFSTDKWLNTDACSSVNSLFSHSADSHYRCVMASYSMTAWQCHKLTSDPNSTVHTRHTMPWFLASPLDHSTVWSCSSTHLQSTVVYSITEYKFLRGHQINNGLQWKTQIHSYVTNERNNNKAWLQSWHPLFTPHSSMWPEHSEGEDVTHFLNTWHILASWSVLEVESWWWHFGREEVWQRMPPFI